MSDPQLDAKLRTFLEADARARAAHVADVSHHDDQQGPTR